MDDPTADTPDSRIAALLATWRARVPGLALALVVAGVGVAIERLVPLLAAAVVAAALGIALRAVLGVPEVARAGVASAGSHGLQVAVVLLGAGVGLQEVVAVGPPALAVLAVTALLGLVGVWWIGRAAGLSWERRSLVTVGTVICGGSAVAALAPGIRARAEDVALALTVVFGMNLVGLLLLPPLGALLGLDQAAFGVWAGAAINDTSSVVAAGYAYGDHAGDVATVVKLTRTTLIVPLVVGFGLWAQRRVGGGDGATRGGLRSLPTFLPFFVLAAALQTAGVIDALGLGFLPDVGRFLLVAALAGVGLGADLGAVRQAGLRPLAVGASGWLLVVAAALAMMSLTGTW